MPGVYEWFANATTDPGNSGGTEPNQKPGSELWGCCATARAGRDEAPKRYKRLYDQKVPGDGACTSDTAREAGSDSWC